MHVNMCMDMRMCTRIDVCPDIRYRDAKIFFGCVVCLLSFVADEWHGCIRNVCIESRVRHIATHLP